MSPKPSTLVETLARASAVPGAGLRLLDRHERATHLTWRGIEDRARGVAAGLQALGVRPGTRVALVFPTCGEFFDAFFGILLAGAAPVPLYPPVRLGRLDEYHRRTARMILLAGAPVVLADARVRRILGETVRLAAPRHGCRTLDALPAGRWSEPATRPDDLGLVQFSSGTTVEPKPVALSHRAILAQTRLLNGFWPDGEDVTHSGVSWLPLYHDMGLIGCVIPALERPAELTLLPPEAFVARPALWLRALSDARATISPAPNFAYALCVHKIRDDELDGVDLSNWRIALNGAEAVVPAVLRRFTRRFERWGFRAEAMTPVYGMSEAALAVTFSEIDRPPTTTRFARRALSEGRAVVDREGLELVSVGRPLCGFEVGIVGDDGAPLAPGLLGQVRVRGTSLMEGYLGLPELTARSLRDGWLDTGDLGFVHRGELYLTGRRKDMLLLRGRNHAPEEVETAVDDIPGVRRGCRVAVSWLPEGAEGEQLVLFVEARAEADAVERRRLADACSSAVPSASGLWPDRVVILAPGTLPRTSSGKLRRRETLRRWLDGTLRPPKPVTLARIAGALVRSRLAYVRSR